MSFNLNDYSFDEWVEFVFNHPVPAKKTRAWYFGDEFYWEGDAKHIINYCIRLFRDPTFLLVKFSPEQINQGFWFLLGATDQLSDWIWDKKIDWTLREDCIMAMVGVFEQMFVRHPIHDACYIWWDLLRNFSDDRDPQTEKAMLAALERILKLNSIDCQMSALHGLGHLENDGRRKVIERFLKARPNLDDEMKDYAAAAMEGKVL